MLSRIRVFLKTWVSLKGLDVLRVLNEYRGDF